MTTTTVGTTYLPQQRRSMDTPPSIPRADLRSHPAEERLIAIGSRVGGFALAWVICQRLLPLPGIAWFVVTGFGCSLLLLVVATVTVDSWLSVRDRAASFLIGTGALIVFAALASAVVFVFARGWHALAHVNFFTQDMTGVGPSDPLTKGGILHAIVGSLVEIGIGVAIALPLGVGTAVYMTEVGGRLARVVRTVVEAMTALPSIVAGLFIYSTFIIALGFPRSGMAAGLAIAVMMLPIIARAADVVLRVVPGGLREASLALGASRWKTVWHVVLPTARPGLATALILGVARGIGETSPVLITSGAAAFLVANPSHGVMNSLPLFIFTTVRSGVPVAIERAFGAASVLLLVVLVLFITARLLARPPGTARRSPRRKKP